MSSWHVTFYCTNGFTCQDNASLQRLRENLNEIPKRLSIDSSFEVSGTGGWPGRTSQRRATWHVRQSNELASGLLAGQCEGGLQLPLQAGLQVKTIGPILLRTALRFRLEGGGYFQAAILSHSKLKSHKNVERRPDGSAGGFRGKPRWSSSAELRQKT